MSKRLLASKPAVAVIGALAAAYFTLVYATSRIKRDPEDTDAKLFSQHPQLLAMWHGQFLLLPKLKPKRPADVRAMVSRHGDAALIGAVLERFGMSLIKGAGAGKRKRNRGGATALRESLRALASGATVAMTADVPPGPARRAGEGIATLASLSGRPVVPFDPFCHVPSTTRARYVPPNPAPNPPSAVAAYRVRVTFSPAASAAAGSSPMARRDSPADVRYRTYPAIATRIHDAYTTASWPNTIGPTTGMSRSALGRSGCTSTPFDASTRGLPPALPRNADSPVPTITSDSPDTVWFDAQRHGQQPVDARQQRAGHPAGEERQREAAGVHPGPEPDDRAEQHHSLDAQVHHARSFGDQLPEGGEQDRGAGHDRAGGRQHHDGVVHPAASAGTSTAPALRAAPWVGGGSASTPCRGAVAGPPVGAELTPTRGARRTRLTTKNSPAVTDRKIRPLQEHDQLDRHADRLQAAPRRR